MWNRRDVLDSANFNTGGLQRTNRGLTAGSRSADAHFHAAYAVITRHVGGVAGGLLRSKWRAFARSAEAERARTLPGEHVAGLVRDRNDCVIEGRLNVHNSKRDVLAFLLLEGFLLALLLRRRCAACCCWFRHEISPRSLVLGRWQNLCQNCPDPTKLFCSSPPAVDHPVK